MVFVHAEGSILENFSRLLHGVHLYLIVLVLDHQHERLVAHIEQEQVGEDSDDGPGCRPNVFLTL